MRFLKLVFILPAVLFAGFCFSQPICGFDNIHQKRMKEDSVYRKSVIENEAKIESYIYKHKSDLSRVDGINNVLYTIPVVVHVINTGGAVGTIYNPSDAQIMSAINYLNQVYNGTYMGTMGVGDLQIQFALASRDTNCNASSGIDRVNGSVLTNYASNGVNQTSSAGVSDIALKNLDRWDPSNFYNIWVVNKIDGNDGTSGQFIAGYAQLGLANYPAATDGIVMLATQMISGQKTLPHEIGHALSLFHPFQGSTDVTVCPTNSNCNTDGDAVCDTDPISENISGGVVDFTCRSGTNSCTGTPYTSNTESNYMNYTSCFTVFTAGQKARMQATMASLPSRITLANSLATGTYPVNPYNAPVVACAAVTGSTGVANDYAGIMSFTAGNKLFTTSDSKGDGGYLNQTNNCLNIVQLQTATSYTFNASVLGANIEQFRGWIDYNNDGIFNNTTEQIYFNSNIPASGSSNFVNLSWSFTVPSTAHTNTVLRMRIMDDLIPGYPGTTTIDSACHQPYYGQAEDYAVFITSSLPVKFQYFNGARNGNNVLLTWKTSSEENTKEFAIDKSVDGLAFTEIGSVAATNITDGSIYSFTDENAGSNKLYYRLREIDIDGKSQLSPVAELSAINGSGIMLKIISNPFTDQLNLMFDDVPSAHTTIQLFDVSGRKVYENNLQITSGQNLRIDLTGYSLTSGIYILRAQSGNQVITEKLVKN